jgi:hypothetical protein
MEITSIASIKLLYLYMYDASSRAQFRARWHAGQSATPPSPGHHRGKGEFDLIRPQVLNWTKNLEVRFLDFLVLHLQQAH